MLNRGPSRHPIQKSKDKLSNQTLSRLKKLKIHMSSGRGDQMTASWMINKGYSMRVGQNNAARYLKSKAQQKKYYFRMRSRSITQEKITKPLSFGQTPKTLVSFLGCLHFLYSKTSLSSCYSISATAILDIIASHKSLPGICFCCPLSLPQNHRKYFDQLKCKIREQTNVFIVLVIS